nr:zinc finger, CCHC-type [Tanacetum cinerariifolium]
MEEWCLSFVMVTIKGYRVALRGDEGSVFKGVVTRRVFGQGVTSIEEDTRTCNEAMQSWDAAIWKESIDDEIGSIMENNTCVLSNLPPGCKPLGFRQKEWIDYFDTYAPVARITTIRLLLALAAIHNPLIHQMDAKTTFLNGDLDEEVYMKQPKGFVMSGNEHKL